MIDQARSDGCDITLDTYPYLPGCTTLASLLPSWASSGGPADTLERLDDPIIRAQIAHAVEVTGCDGGHGIPTNWDEIQIGETTHPSLEGFAGRRMAEVSRQLGVPPIELFFDILIKDRLATSCLMHIGNEENVQTIMKHETHMSGSDAILHGKSTHPRVSLTCNLVTCASIALVLINVGVRYIPPVPRTLRARHVASAH